MYDKAIHIDRTNLTNENTDDKFDLLRFVDERDICRCIFIKITFFPSFVESCTLYTNHHFRRTLRGDNADTVYTDYVQYQLQALRNANVVRKWCELITSINPTHNTRNTLSIRDHR